MLLYNNGKYQQEHCSKLNFLCQQKPNLKVDEIPPCCSAQTFNPLIVVQMLPSVKSSPLERLQDMTSSSSKPRYYYNANRDPASGASAPPSPHSPGNNPPPTPRTPGYVLHTASNWQDPDKVPSTVSDRIQHWFKSRPPGKAP